MIKSIKFGCKQLTKSILQPNGCITSKNHIRCLFSRRELGIEGYEEARRDVEQIVGNQLQYKKNFRKMFMNGQCDMKKYENGLKDLIYMIDNNPDDIMILKDALNTLVHKQKRYEGKKYSFGTVVMRAFHHLNMPAQAIKFFDDEILHELFTQMIGHQILLDMLYENEFYGDVVRVHEQLDEAGYLGSSFRRHLDVIVLATYYRLNSPEALEEAYALWKRMNVKGRHQYRKCRTFVAGLAIKQQKPDLALQILEEDSDKMYITVRQNILLAHIQLAQYDEVNDMFRLILERHEENGKEYTTSIQILNDIEESFKQNASEDEFAEFLDIRNVIESRNLVTEKTHDDLLLAPFPAQPPMNAYFKRK